ncbi:MAG: hypothetical protein ACOVNR_05040, partial [Chitinophagaceae bacterium]
KTYAPASAFNLMILSELLPQLKKVTDNHTFLQPYVKSLMEDWQKMDNQNLYANNFFLDEGKQERLQKLTYVQQQVGNVLAIGKIDAENKLRGTFIIQGSKGTASVFFSLTPEKMPKIQSLEVTLISK